MVIDVHVHPTGYSLISQDPEERKFRDKVFQRKYDESKLPIAMTGKPSGGNSGCGCSTAFILLLVVGVAVIAGKLFGI